MALNILPTPTNRVSVGNKVIYGSPATELIAVTNVIDNVIKYELPDLQFNPLSSKFDGLDLEIYTYSITSVTYKQLKMLVRFVLNKFIEIN